MLLGILVVAALVGLAAGDSDKSKRMMQDDWKKPDYKAYEIHSKDEEYMKTPLDTLNATRRDIPGTRQECRTLDVATRKRNFQCIQRLYTAPSPSGQDTMYALFEKWHRRTMSPGAHGGCCFLPWHRQFIARFEQTCREVCGDPNFNLCYWDLTLDSQMPAPCQSAIFSEFFFGNPSGPVWNGLAANKPCIGDCVQMGSTVTRDCGGPGYSLSSPADADAFVNRLNFRALATPVAFTYAEDFHGPNHMYVGAHMSLITCSPCDPLFFAYHGWVDYLWDQQQRRQKSQNSDPGQGYPTDTDVPPSHRADSPTTPFSPLCRDGIRYPSPFTPYSQSPRVCTNHADCNGDALWCNGGRCMGSVRPGAVMQTGWPIEACYIETCQTRVNRGGFCACAG